MSLSPPDVDLPNQSDAITELAHSDVDALRNRALSNLFVFANICGFHDPTDGAHGALCVFVRHNPAKRKLILYFRGGLKSSVVTIAANLQKACGDSEQRILIRNEIRDNAQRFLHTIRQICEKNRVIRGLFGSILPRDTRKVRWNDSELDFNRKSMAPEPTFDTNGILGASTSRHYTHITDDDPISENALESEAVMRSTIERIGGTESLFESPQTASWWIIGTRWARYDVYSHLEKTYGNRLTKFVRAILEPDPVTGELVPVWPEKFGVQEIADLRDSSTSARFNANQMNAPRDDELQDFNASDIRFWRWLDGRKTHIELIGPTLSRVIAFKDLDITATLDPAISAKKKSDRNAISIVGTIEDAMISLDSWAMRKDPLAVISAMFDLHEKWHPRKWGIEAVAYQRSLKFFVQAEAIRRGVYLNIVDISAVGDKEARIRGLQPVAATGRLYLAANQLILRQEIDDFPLGQFDDALDSLAMQLQICRNPMPQSLVEKLKVVERKMIAQVKKDRGIFGADEDDDGAPSDAHLWKDQNRSWIEVA